MVVARDETGAAVDRMGGQGGARTEGQQGQQARRDLPAAVHGPCQRADLAAAVEERRGVRGEQGDEPFAVLRRAGLTDRAREDVVPVGRGRDRARSAHAGRRRAGEQRGRRTSGAPGRTARHRGAGGVVHPAGSGEPAEAEAARGPRQPGPGHLDAPARRVGQSVPPAVRLVDHAFRRAGAAEHPAGHVQQVPPLVQQLRERHRTSTVHTAFSLTGGRVTRSRTAVSSGFHGPRAVWRARGDGPVRERPCPDGDVVDCRRVAAERSALSHFPAHPFRPGGHGFCDIRAHTCHIHGSGPVIGVRAGRVPAARTNVPSEVRTVVEA